MLCLVAWKRIQASNGADVQLTIGGRRVHFMPVWFTLAAIILTSTITILRTPFVEQGLLYAFFSYRACLQSRLVWIPSVNTQYREIEGIHRERASHYLASLKYTNEESYPVTF
jgi:hypothetical protein